MFETVNLGQLYNMSIRPASLSTATAIKSLILSQLFRPPTAVSRSWSNTIVLTSQYQPRFEGINNQAFSGRQQILQFTVIALCLSLLRGWNIQMKYFPVHRNLLVGVFFLFFHFFVKHVQCPVLRFLTKHSPTVSVLCPLVRNRKTVHSIDASLLWCLNGCWKKHKTQFSSNDFNIFIPDLFIFKHELEIESTMSQSWIEFWNGIFNLLINFN